MDDTEIETAYLTAKRLLSGQMPEDEAISLLRHLHKKGETVADLVGFSRAMREAAIPVSLPHPLLDLCGTGGSGKDRFNLSSAVSLLLAADGIPVAKHGNRGSRGPNGSFDFLDALGIPFFESPDQVADQFKRCGLCFIFARYFHPMVGKLAPIRAKLGHPTIFNLLGPLCNPAQVTHQVIGTPTLEKAKLMADTLQLLGIQKGVVVYGQDGRDELSLTQRSTLFVIQGNMQLKDEFDPTTLAQFSALDQDFSFKNAAESASLFEKLVVTKDCEHPIALWMFLNAGLCFWVMDRVPSIRDGFFHAQSVFTSSKLGEKLSQLRRLG